MIWEKTPIFSAKFFSESIFKNRSQASNCFVAIRRRRRFVGGRLLHDALDLGRSHQDARVQRSVQRQNDPFKSEKSFQPFCAATTVFV
jgi:hypothetical protein